MVVVVVAQVCNLQSLITLGDYLEAHFTAFSLNVSISRNDCFAVADSFEHANV
jgi:hypothetical protein